MGMHRLAFAWTGRPLAAAVAGIGYAFNGLLFNSLMWPNNIAALGWMPWVVLLVDRGWFQGGRTLLLAILVSAIQMLAGAPEIIIFTWSIIAAIWFGYWCRMSGFRSTLVRRAIIIVLFVSALIAAQLLPFLDLLLHSQRTSNFSDVHWALPKTGWLNFFLPLFGFYKSPSGVCFQPHQEWTSSYYAGIGIVLLALVALRYATRARVMFLWLVTILGIVLSMGEGGWLYSALCDAFPAMSLMRFPVKFVVLPIFALPLLAAYGVMAVEQGKEHWSRWSVTASTLVCVSVVVGAAIYALSQPPMNLSWATIAENGVSRIACVLLVAGAVLLTARVTRPAQGALFGFGLLAGLALDAFTHVPWQNPTVAASAYDAGMLRTQLKTLPEHGTDRAMMARRTHDKIYGSMLPDTFNDYCGRRLSLFGNCNILDDVPTIDGFYSLYLPGQREVWADLFFASSNQFTKPLANFVGISRAVTNLFEWEKRPSALPLATIGQKPVFVESGKIRDRMMAGDFDPARTVFLPAEYRPDIRVTSNVTARIITSRWRNGRAELEVKADSRTMLVVAQSFHHAWRATVQGQPAKIFPANHAFQAIEVPMGRSRVEFVFKDNKFRIGSAISLASLLLLGICWCEQRETGLRNEA
jgi:hypothetical protein